MGASLFDFVLMGIGTLGLLFWLFLFATGKQYDALFVPLTEKDYMFNEVYRVGYRFMELIGYTYRSKSDRRLRQNLDILYLPKFSEYYLRVVYAQRVTMALTLFVVAFPIYAFSGEIMALVILLMFSGLAYYYYGTVPKKMIAKRSEQILSDFCEVVSKLALLTNAGLVLREAWKEVAYASDTIVYEEMQKACDDMSNGMSDEDALYKFGNRCVLPEVKKFTSTIIQGISKGNRELSGMLQQQSKEVWELKKQLVRRQGEKAASKLLIPICIMFVGILIMVVVPIFTNLGAA